MTMKPISINSNYQISHMELGSVTFENVDHDCDLILDEFSKDIGKENQDRVMVGSHPEHTDIKERYRAVRVLKVYGSDKKKPPTDGRGMHRASVDIIFNHINDRLTIEMQVCAHTWLKYLTNVIKITFFILLFLFLFNVYLSFGGFKSILLSYVQTNLNAPTNEALGVAQQLLRSGFEFRHFFFGFNENFQANIAVIVSSCWMAIMGTSGISGFIIHKIPPWCYSVIFRLIGQPTIREYEAFVSGHTAWVKQILAGTLHQLRIDHSGVTYR